MDMKCVRIGLLCAGALLFCVESSSFVVKAQEEENSDNIILAGDTSESEYAYGSEEAASEEESVSEEEDVTWTLAFAKVEDEGAYVNVRDEASTQSGEVIGILRNKDSAVIESVEEGGWYKIVSGDVEGYVAQYLLVTGEEAESIAAETAYRFARVFLDYADVTTEAFAESEVITSLENGDEVECVSYEGGAYVRVALDPDTYGYVSADCVELVTDYPTGETIEQMRGDEVSEQEAFSLISFEMAEDGDAAYDEGLYESSDYSDYTCEYEDPYDQETASEIYTEEAEQDSSSGGELYSEQTYTETVDEDASQTFYQPTETYEAANETDEGSDAADDVVTEVTDSYTDYQTVEDEGADTVSTDDASSTDDSGTTDGTDEYDSAAVDYTASTASGSATASAAASYACQFVGNPYLWGGTSLTDGADCSGFTQSVYAHFGVSLPHDAASQASCGTAVSFDSLAVGDLVFFSSSGGAIDHVAIYIGGGSIVHAANADSGICYGSLTFMTPVAACRVC